tara:strand:+ start:485 stop:733 length:249 start_codon:yes stop_codon:yes gene_type:complete
MSRKKLFKNVEFDKKIKSLNNTIEHYLNEKEFKLTDITLEELVQWHDVSTKGPRQIYPHEKCPSQIKNIVQNFINEEFKNPE